MVVINPKHLWEAFRIPLNLVTALNANFKNFAPFQAIMAQLCLCTTPCPSTNQSRGLVLGVIAKCSMRLCNTEDTEGYNKPLQKGNLHSRQDLEAVDRKDTERRSYQTARLNNAALSTTHKRLQSKAVCQSHATCPKHQCLLPSAVNC